MKKSLLIIHNSMEGGGAERVMLTLLRNLNRSKWDITLMLIYGEGVFIDGIPDDIEVLKLFPSHKTFGQRLITHWAGIRNGVRKLRAEQLLGNRKFDVTVSFMEGATACLHHSLLSRAPFNCSWIHNDIDINRWYSFWVTPEKEKLFYRHIDRIAFVSDDASKAFERVIDCDNEHCVIYNPVDSKAIRAAVPKTLERQDDTFTIINVGRFVPAKRQDRLIRAAAILKKRGYRFRVKMLGCGKLESELKDLAQRLDVADRIEMPGFVNNPYEVMAQADLFCLTSVAEGYPMVITEALTLGLPVASTRITGVKEMLAHGGGEFTGDEPEDIADVLEGLISNPGRLEELRADAIESSRQFDIATVMARINDFLTPDC